MNAIQTAESIVRDHPKVARAIYRMMCKDNRRGLTARMRQLLEFIEDYYDQKAIMPSYEEMRVGIGSSSKSRIHHLVLSLEERGYVRRMAGKARSLELVA